MASETMKDDEARYSGIPGPHELGESRSEVVYVVIGLIVFALIAVSFWYEATH
jgi:hypothetical protein